MHFYPSILPYRRFFGRLCAVDMAVIAVLDVPLYQNVQDSPALHVIVYRRVVKEHYRTQTLLFCFVQRSIEPASFPGDDLPVLLGFGIIQPPPGATDGDLPYRAGAVVNHEKIIKAAFGPELFDLGPGAPPIIVVAL